MSGLEIVTSFHRVQNRKGEKRIILWQRNLTNTVSAKWSRLTLSYKSHWPRMLLIQLLRILLYLIANTLFQQHNRSLYTWTSPDGQYQNQIGYILCSQRWGISRQSEKTRPGADCGYDREILIAKFTLKLKKVGKTTLSFRYNLNQIPYYYTVKVRNRFTGLDLIDRVPDELWTEVCVTVQETGIKTISKGEKMAKSKMVVWGGLKNSCEKKRSERQRRKGKIYPFECRVPKNSKEDKKALPSDQCKEIEENNRMGKTRDLFKKIRDTKGTFHAKMGSIRTEMVWA